MLRFIISLLFFVFSPFAVAEFFEHEIEIFNGGVLALSKTEALNSINYEIENSFFGFHDMGIDIHDGPLSDLPQPRAILQKLIETEAHRFCKRFICEPNSGVACQRVARKNNSNENNILSEEYKLSWEEKNRAFYITKLVCSSEQSDLDEWSMVDEGTLVESELAVKKSWLSSWWGTTSEPAEPIVDRTVALPSRDQSGEESYLMTLWKYGDTVRKYTGAAVKTIGPAVQTWVEAKQDADLLNPNTWNLYGQLYELGTIWAAQATLAMAGALGGDGENVEDEKQKVYLDEIIELAERLIKNENKDLTDKQVSILRLNTKEAKEELAKFKERKAADLHKMVSVASSVLPVSLPEAPPPAISPPLSAEPSALGRSLLSDKKEVKSFPFSQKPPAFTFRQVQESAKKGKVAAKPTLADLEFQQFLRGRFEILKQILEFPIAKWRIQKDAMDTRFLHVDKRGALEYQKKLWVLAQDLMEDSQKVDSRRTLKYFYAEPGNGKTSGIEEMFVGWVGLPLCKINHDEISGRNRPEYPTVTGYVKHRILDCLKTVYTEKTTGLKVRNGIVLFDDFDRILDKDGELSQGGSTKDREEFFLLLKKLGDPSDQTMDVEIKTKVHEVDIKVMYPVRISDLYIFITANSIPSEFDPSTPKTATITSLLSRIEIYQVPYADREQRYQLLLDSWKGVEQKLNVLANGNFVIDHELCLESLQAILDKDCEALDKMKGKMGVRGLIEFFKRFKGTIQTRAIRPDICRLAGNGSGDIPFDIAREAESIGEYQKEQTENLRLDAFNKEVTQFLKEWEEEINGILEPELFLVELQILKNAKATMEVREAALGRIREMLAALNPPSVMEMDGSEKKRIIKLINEQLKYVGAHNLRNIIDIANLVLKNLTYGGSENMRSSMVFVKQDGATDLGIISKLAEILGLPYCRIDGSVPALATKTPIIWKNYQKEKEGGTVYIRIQNNASAATWDEVRKVYSVNYGNTRYIAGNFYSPQNYSPVEVNDLEWNRWTSTDSQWIDICARQLKKHELKDLSHVLVLIDRTKENTGFDATLLDALSESLEGLTRRPTGAKIDMRKATIVFSVDNEKINAEHTAAIEKMASVGKITPVSIHPLTAPDRLQFAEIHLRHSLETIAKDLKLSFVPELNDTERILFQFIGYLDLTAFWQVHEKLNKNIMIDPLREMINQLANDIKNRATAFLSLEEELEDCSLLFQEWAAKWKYYYATSNKYPIDVPELFPAINKSDYGTDNWKEIIQAWTQKDKAHYLEQKRLAEEERLREEKRLREEEEQRKREEELRHKEEEQRRQNEERLKAEEERRLKEVEERNKQEELRQKLAEEKRIQEERRLRAIEEKRSSGIRNISSNGGMW